MDNIEFMPCHLWKNPELAGKFPGHEDLSLLGLRYLDNAATTQRLGVAIQRQFAYETSAVGNANRGAHALAAKSSELLFQARVEIASFIGVGSDQIALVSGATEGANLIAMSARSSLKPSDCVYVSQIEHHSNFLPWREAATAVGASFKIIPANANGELDLDWFERNVALDRPAWLSISAMSNVTGYSPPIRWMAATAKSFNPAAVVVVDGAQAIGRHMGRSDAWGGDFAFFSGHKMHGPSGIGVIYASSGCTFKGLAPGKFGGGMVSGIRSDGSPRWLGGSSIYEAGSANVGAALGLAEAAKEVGSWDFELLAAHEETLSTWLAEKLSSLDGVRVFGSPGKRAGLVAFDASWAHAHDIGTVLDAKGVLARVGHHCALPLMRAMDCSSCVRLSFGALSCEADAFAAYDAVVEAKRMLS